MASPKFPQHQKTRIVPRSTPLLVSILFTSLLAACGGGGGGSAAMPGTVSAPAAASSVASVITSNVESSSMTEAPAAAPVAAVQEPVPAAVTTTVTPTVVPNTTTTATAPAVTTSTSPATTSTAESTTSTTASTTASSGTSSTSAANTPQAAPAPVVTAPAPTTSGSTTTAPTQTAGTVIVISQGATLTDVRFENTSNAGQVNAPVTFGQVFAPGALLATDALVGKLADGSTVQLQMDIKATHADKSVRHAVLSAVLPVLAVGQSLSMNLTKASVRYTSQKAATAADLLAAGFTGNVTLNVGGVAYTASADELLRTTTPKVWLAGRVANEWMVSAPFKTAAGVAHPHLTARFYIRSYFGLNKAKVDVVVENNWAYEAGPQNVSYDAQVAIGGKTVYTKSGLSHYHHARWKKTFWWGAAPEVHVKHNAAYLVASRAVPNYDLSVTPTAAVMQRIKNTFVGAVTEPMQNGLAQAYMPQTGGRWDLGILPGWAVSYLLTMDKDAKVAMMGTADLAGSWSWHYRDKNTDRVMSLVDYPYATILGREGDTYNPVTKKSDKFPACGGDCKTPLTGDSSHQPNFAYLPYIVSGDYYYLEELQFWAMMNMVQHNPGYRDNVKGLVKGDQTRGQAWSMRLLADAAYITPDADVLRGQFETFLSNNLDWFNATYVNGAPNNALGAVIDSNALVYDSGVGIAPWQDDFFTMAIGHAAELGFAKAKNLLLWKSTFPVGRIVGQGYCWIDGSIYKMKVRDAAGGANYTSFAAVYQASQTAAVTSTACGSAAMASLLGLKVGEMVGYADVIDGYPAYMQPALAYSVDSGNPEARAAWSNFMSRPVKPNYANGAQFAILPR